MAMQYLSEKDDDSRTSKIRIALISKATPTDGGEHTFEKSFIEYLNQINFKSIEFVSFFTDFHSRFFRFFNNNNKLNINGSVKLAIAIQYSYLLSSLSSRMKKKGTKIDRFLTESKFDCVVFLSPNPISLLVKTTPMVNVVWDLGHRDLPDLSEFSTQNTFAEREFMYANTLPRSSSVLTDSRSTSANLEKIYNVNKNRISEIGLLPPEPSAEILPVPENLRTITTSKYLIYPSQFWTHKNHIRLIRAFSNLQRDFPELKLVFTGSEKGALVDAEKEIVRLNLISKIENLGFVTRDEYWSLLSESTGLVFPSLLGPTNLPPLEASAIGKKMAISEFHRNMLGKHDHIEYFDPRSVTSIENGMRNMLDKPDGNPTNYERDNLEKTKLAVLTIISNLPKPAFDSFS